MPRQAKNTGASRAEYSRSSARVAPLNDLREAARSCRDCPLWAHATQTVFGEGSQRSLVVLVGEQPGDQEDRQGKPFVGPAGRLLDRALAEAGIKRSSLYVTNAVKHFKFQLRGKRRLHKTPAQQEIAACHQWLAGELGSIRPRLIVLLGATAARAVLGRKTTIEASRGRILDRAHADPAADVLVTVHPSYLLRVPPQDRQATYRRFLDDLRLILPYLSRGARPVQRRKTSAAERRAHQ